METTAVNFIKGILTHPTILEENLWLTEDVIDTLINQISIKNSKSYIEIVDIAKESQGLNVNQQNVSLASKWGTILTSKMSTYIDKPSNIHYINDQFLITNSNDDSDSFTACAVFDKEMNFLGTVGKKGTLLNQGQYSSAADFTYSALKKKYYIVSSADNIVHIYNSYDKQYITSLGDGTQGADGNKLDTPLSIAIGKQYTYVLCNKGTPLNATGEGFIVAYDQENQVQSIPLFCGKNNGNGKCFEREIKNPKDMVLFHIGNIEHLMVLNGNNEIGIFNTTNWDLVDIINLPIELGNLTDFGLTRIALEGDTIYLAATNIGKVIAISMREKKLIGMFGKLADESLMNDDTLGLFNGLTGIAIKQGLIYTAEKINNRIQVFGSNLLNEKNFYIQFKNFAIPNSNSLTGINSSLSGNPFSKVSVIDENTKQEYDIETAVSRQINNFSVKAYIEPYKFTRLKPVLDIFPINISLKVNN